MINIEPSNQYHQINVRSGSSPAVIEANMSIYDLLTQIRECAQEMEGMLSNIKQYVERYIDLDLDIPTKISDLNDDIGIENFMTNINNASTLEDYGIEDAVTYEEVEEE